MGLLQTITKTCTGILGLGLINIAIAAPGNHVVYTEAAATGPGSIGMYSLNYEHMMNQNVSFRLGGGYFTRKVSQSGKAISHHHTMVPVMVNFIDGPMNHKIEFGAGINFTDFRISTMVNHQQTFLPQFAKKVMTPVVVVGYRYQPNTSGISLRAGVTSYLSHKARFMPHTSLGYRF